MDRLYFTLDDVLYPADSIEYLELAGGAYGHGCWGKIQLKGEVEPTVIGDGSYYGHAGYNLHRLAGSPSKRDYGFKQLRHVMRVLGTEEGRDGSK